MRSKAITLFSIDRFSGNGIITFGLVAALAIAGFVLFRFHAHYEYMSASHFNDILLAKFWTMTWTGSMIFIIWKMRQSRIAPNLAVFAVSAYFVILYGLLFRGTEFGLNGYSGDMAGIYAEICKMMAFNSFFQDFFTKNLPSFYPPMWFAILAFYGDLVGIEAYQTYRYGYLLVFLVYPWLIYFSWKPLVGPIKAAAVSVATLFLATKYVDLLIHEHTTLALFIPWWLYFFEGVGDNADSNWRHYLWGGIIGGVIFMTYYYWFFIAFAALPITLAFRYHESRSIHAIKIEILHRIKMLISVAVFSSIYWLPLLFSVISRGFTSAQNVWFYPRHADLIKNWQTVSIEAILIFLGIGASFYLWNRFGRARLPLFFLGCIVIILLDRLLNLNALTIQSRKITDFVHVMTIAPLAIALVYLWRKYNNVSLFKNVTAGFVLLLLIIAANGHTEIFDRDSRYKSAYEAELPERELSVFEAADVNGKVILTYAYNEAAFIPYYSFTPANNMSAHMAGQYLQRVDFIELASQLTDAELLAYVLKHNRYDMIDYIYMKREPQSHKFQLQLNQVKFNEKQYTKYILFELDFTSHRPYFKLLHNSGLFEINAPAEDKAIVERLKLASPKLLAHLRN